jgi:hypothetical protein
MSFDPPHPSDDLSATLVWTPGPGSRSTCQIGRRIGAGGFAEVFVAVLQHPNQPPQRIALKRLLPSLRGDPLRRRLLRREAQIGASLNHPNIARVLSLIELGSGQSGEVALAMELCEGMQCNHLLYRLSQHGLGLTLPAVAHIASGLFAALKYLENPLGKNRPLVHADISLENLMLTRAGEVKLIDFGIAAEDQYAMEAGTEEALTSLHQTAGKRPYLPPEGMPPRGPSSQSDLYAAGVCFWELCTGSRFPLLPLGVGEREMGSLITFAAAGLPEPAWQLLNTCLSVDPEARLRMADAALLLCHSLGERADVARKLGSLVERAMVVTRMERSPLARPRDFFDMLCRRLRHAFCAHRVYALAPAAPADDQSGIALCEPLYTLRAQDGEPVDETALPKEELLHEVLDTGFAETPDGALLFRVKPPGDRAHLVCIEAGADAAYDELGQSLLRNLLHAASK